ncbi:MAG: hypothetical protein ACTS2F_03565 [Thainema sp.]
MKRFHVVLSVLSCLVVIAGFTLLNPIGLLSNSSSSTQARQWWHGQSAIAQLPTERELRRLIPEQIAAYVYQQFPDLPLENQYIDDSDNEVDEDGTLVSRMIDYHTRIVRRPTQYRLDWKLTIADYLDENEIIIISQYPGSSRYETNPVRGDKAAIARLSPEQRNALVNTLVAIYNPAFAEIAGWRTYPEAFSSPQMTPEAQAEPATESSTPTDSSMPNSSSGSPIPARGSADLLR